MVKLPPETSAPVKFAVARAAGEVVEPGADLLERERAGVLDHRHDQALLAERGSDADVDGRRDRDPVLFPAAVDRRRGGHRFGRGLDDVGGVAELDAALGQRRLVRGDGGKIGFEQGGDVRRFGDRADHVLGDLQAHSVVRDVVRRELARLRRRRLADADHGRLGNAAIDILARDAAIAAGAGDARRVDPVLLERPADGRG